MSKGSLPLLFISSVSDGHMGVSAPQNREKYFAKLGIDKNKVVDIAVDHTDKVKVVGKKDAGKFFEGYDAVITREKGLVLGLTTADCLPIAVFDPVNNSVGLIHAGWRGLVNGIIGKTIKEFKSKWKAKSDRLIIYIGPHICRKHYEVKSDVSVKFKKYPEALRKVGGKLFLDIGMVARMQLTDSGVVENNIQMSELCNFENKNLFSYRRGDKKGRNLYLFGIPLDSSRGPRQYK